MIDLHLHLLPDIDDGSPSLAVSRAMIERAREFGFQTLVTTPHLSGPLSPSMAGRITEALTEVRLAAAVFGVEVLLGYEIMLTPNLPARLTAGEPITLAGSRAVLVELPLGVWPPQAEQTLFELQLAGFHPVLAHPERYQAVQRDPDRAARLADRGIALQITLGSLVGLFGRDAQRIAERLIRSGAARLVASDAHSAGRRFMAVEDGLQRLESLVGPALLAQITDAAPRALLADAPLPPPLELLPPGSTGGWRAAIRREFRRGKH